LVDAWTLSPGVSGTERQKEEVVEWLMIRGDVRRKREAANVT